MQVAFEQRLTSRPLQLQEHFSSATQRTLDSTPNMQSPFQPSPLLPPTPIHDGIQSYDDPLDSELRLSDLPSYSSNLEDRLSPPIETQRPKSALHAGNFTEDTKEDQELSGLRPYQHASSPTLGPLGHSPTTPWYQPPSSSGIFDLGFPYRDENESIMSERSRAPSLSSYSSSYVLKAPTTPLVQQTNNNDIDFSPMDLSESPNRANRRRTLPPQAFSTFQSRPEGHLPSQAQRYSRNRRESSLPHQGHRTRNSLAPNWSLQAPSPRTPNLRPRRLSHSEYSPLYNASMVGSYEESMLRGLLSTAPSRHLEFAAQIGVLGKANCKPSCPAHVTIPFPAVFYSWNSGNMKTFIDDEPSPYVGHIDLQSSIPPSKERRRKEKIIDVNGGGTSVGHDGVQPTKRRRKRSFSPRTPPGGSYRIPEQGQLQIVIKNPNKTAVKLFLVPYDLTGMEGSTKTFIRQRCYSTEDAGEKQPLKPKRPSLRYLIHLNICSPSRGRFYLHQQIRVVFANRVQDSREKLQNEIQIPQPRFSPYRPNRDSWMSSATKPIQEKSHMRQSLDFDVEDFSNTKALAIPPLSLDLQGTMPPVPAIPFNIVNLRQRPRTPTRPAETDAMEVDVSRPTTSSDLQSPLSDKTNRAAGLSGSFKSTSSNSSDGFGKLKKGESGYEGRSGALEPGEGLLAKKLRSLGVQKRLDYGEEYI